MKFRVFPILLLTCFLAPSCGNKQSNNEEEVDSLAVTQDSVLIDTIETEVVPVAAPPKKADELFDDFVYAFMRNKKFQRSRIQFPLKNIVNGANEPISSTVWKHDPLYSGRDIYMTISPSIKAIGFSKDTSINHVFVQEICPRTSQVKQYTFERKNSQWKLYEIRHENVEKLSEGSDFLSFYCKFSTDPEFQAQSVAEVINVKTFDEEEGREVDGIITAEQWPDFAPVLPKDEIMCVRYGKNYKNSDMRIVNLASPSGDAGVTMTFKKKNGEWTLVSYAN